MLIANQAKESGITIQGVLFTQSTKVIPKEIFMEHMQAVRDIMDLPVIGFVPFFKQRIFRGDFWKKDTKKVSFKVLLNFSC